MTVSRYQHLSVPQFPQTKPTMLPLLGKDFGSPLGGLSSIIPMTGKVPVTGQAKLFPCQQLTSAASHPGERWGPQDGAGQVVPPARDAATRTGAEPIPLLPAEPARPEVTTQR